MKIVINSSYGAAEVSKSFCKKYGLDYKKQFGIITVTSSNFNIRTDSRLIEYIEKYGSKAASGPFSRLIVQEIPKGSIYRIHNYDGTESVELIGDGNWYYAEY